MAVNSREKTSYIAYRDYLLPIYYREGNFCRQRMIAPSLNYFIKFTKTAISFLAIMPAMQNVNTYSVNLRELQIKTC